MAVTFRPLEHIRRRAEFEAIYEGGTRVGGRLMTLFVKPNQSGRARLGVASTRKMGGAVVRNRAKRLSREIFRHHKPSASLDIVVVPRREFLDAPYASLEQEFDALLARAERQPELGRREPRRARRAGADPRV